MFAEKDAAFSANKGRASLSPLLVQNRSEGTTASLTSDFETPRSGQEENTFTPPFAIPESWVWVRLGDICESNIGLTYTPQNIKNSGIPVLRSNNIQNGIIVYNDLVFLDEKLQIKESCFVKMGDILMCARNGSSKLVGKVAIVEKENMAFGAFMTIIRSKYNSFLKVYFESAIFRKHLEGVNTTTINQITQDKLKSFPIPLPPLQEQKQIVQILDQLMDLANEFERTQENLKRIEKSLLKFAIEGNLSKCYRKDNPTLNALSEIESYNASILKDKRAKEKALKTLESSLKNEKDKEAKQNLKSQITALKRDLAKLKIITPLTCHSERSEESHIMDFNSDISLVSQARASEAFAHTCTYDKASFTPPFEIPESWVWVRLGEICEAFTGNSINADKKEKEFTGHQEGLNYIGTKDITMDRQIIYENGIKITKHKLDNFKIAKKYSTLLCLEGGSAGKKIGFLRENVCFGNKLCCFEASFCNTKFLYFYLQTPNFLQEFNLNLVGIIGGVGKDKIKDFLIPLPPLNEQEHITKTLDSLFTLAKGLKVE